MFHALYLLAFTFFVLYFQARNQIYCKARFQFYYFWAMLILIPYLSINFGVLESDHEIEKIVYVKL